MKKGGFLLAGLLSAAIGLFSLASPAEAVVHVNGYYRSNGTYVAPHYRSDPDGSFSNNWSTVGNVNPYTGKEGTKTSPDSGSYNYGSSYNYGTTNYGTAGTQNTYVAPIIPTCPTNGYYSYLTNKCVCNSGYSLDATAMYCQANLPDCDYLGPAGTLNITTKQCTCLSGFLYNSSLKTCVNGTDFCAQVYGKEESYFDSSTNNCHYCEKGWTIDRGSNKCSKKNSCVDEVNGYYDPTSQTCKCLAGFTWSTDQNKCVQAIQPQARADQLSPELAARSYFDFLNKGFYYDAFTLFSADLQKKTNFDKWKNGYSGTNSQTVQDVTCTKNSCLVTVEASETKPMGLVTNTYTFLYQFAQDSQGNYKIKKSTLVK